jgi:hypothetical protein
LGTIFRIILYAAFTSALISEPVWERNNPLHIRLPLYWV